MKRIVLKQRAAPIHDGQKQWTWEVIKLTNATYPNIGQNLNRDEVNDFCDNVDWEVVIS